MAHLISLAPLPDAWGLHTKEGEWIPANNNHPNHQQFEHGQEGSNVPEGTNKQKKEQTGLGATARGDNEMSTKALVSIK